MRPNEVARCKLEDAMVQSENLVDMNQILQFEADNQRIPGFLLVFFTTQKAEFWIFFELKKKIWEFFLTMYSKMQQYAYMSLLIKKK